MKLQLFAPVALVLLAAHGVLSEVPQDDDDAFEEQSIEMIKTTRGNSGLTPMIHGDPDTNPNGDCESSTSFPSDSDTPYWEWGPCDPYWEKRHYCEKGCKVASDGHNHHHQKQNARVLGGNDYSYTCKSGCIVW
eukprot:CAMPEP_0172306258 /NCGR_PEP_ID=MMETSP1058-20130122/7366_1 /TAXON_ID=83371 /ORGANISM="Detonula confervacea, Strain CCMP 353" /LENGTH=133 /DNA_ID=CAMNT_0013018083 /DNA_START=412 /DNA_END=810 /DNA_ORIENTATION=+